MNLENPLPSNTLFTPREAAPHSKLKMSDRRAIDPLMTVDQLAVFANLSNSKIYHDVEAGKIPVRRWGKRQAGKKPILRFKRSEILMWLDWGCPNARDFLEKLENLTLTGAK